MNKFKMSNETKFGMKPHFTRINYETLQSKIKEVFPTTSIWESLGFTEEEYYAKYHKQTLPEKAIEIENELKNKPLEK